MGHRAGQFGSHLASVAAQRQTVYNDNGAAGRQFCPSTARVHQARKSTGMIGQSVYLYAYDVAGEIKTDKVRHVLGTTPVPFEMQSQRTLPRDVPIYKPLTVELARPLGTIGGRPLCPLVRIYEVGVVSIVMRVAFEVDTLAQLHALHTPKLDDGTSLDAVARRLCDEVIGDLQPAMIDGGTPTNPEGYTVFCLTQIADVSDVNRWLSEHRIAVAELLSESKPQGLSDMQVAEVLRVARSYGPADLVVIDWDAALAIDLDGRVDDVLYVLELANLQLEEYRVMDARLDRYLDRAYEDLKLRRFGLLGTYTKRLSSLRLFRVDVTKLNDEVTHISKFFGDWYLARVYLGAWERFYLAQWRGSVEDRLEQLDQLYTVVNSDVNNRRMVVLEVLVVIFFAIDLAMLAFWRR
jgi:hypothetical protein